MKLIACAFELEAHAFLKNLDIHKSYQWNFSRICEGQYRNEPVLLCIHGVGKVQAAMTLQYVFDKYDIDCLYETGIAGALNPDLRLMDTVIGTKLYQHDMDARAFGFSLGEIPYTKLCCFQSKQPLQRLQCFERVFEGVIVSGDQFVDTKERRLEIFRHFSADAVDMESAAAVMAAEFNKIPWHVIRTISDTANEHISIDFVKLVKNASNKHWQLFCNNWEV